MYDLSAGFLASAATEAMFQVELQPVVGTYWQRDRSRELFKLCVHWGAIVFCLAFHGEFWWLWHLCLSCSFLVLFTSTTAKALQAFKKINSVLFEKCARNRVNTEVDCLFLRYKYLGAIDSVPTKMFVLIC